MQPIKSSGQLSARNEYPRAWTRRSKRATKVLCSVLLATFALGVTAAARAQDETDIARGEDVPDGNFAWAVSLHDSAVPSTANLMCSGSHVAPNFVLSAAHCFDFNLNGVISADELSANEMWASLNRTRLSERGRGEVIQGNAIFLNPDNDIALLRLSRSSSAPIVQLDPNTPANGTNVTTAGWGFFTRRIIPNNMQQGAFRVTGAPGFDLRYVNRNTEEMCGGDSGGPVFTEFNGLARVVAAHTNSPGGCGVATGTATGSRVQAAISWIRQVIDTNGFDRRGWVWANRPTTADYSPATSYSFNSAGQPNRVRRTGTGRYQVFFDGLAGPRGHVQVTAYGSAVNHCKVSGWGSSGGSLRASIRCFRRNTGAAVDTKFNAVFIDIGNSRQPGSEIAYLWANNATAASYTPSSSYQKSSSGATSTIRRLGIGRYDATLPGLSGSAGTVHVTAYGSGSEICNVGNWVPSGPATKVRINCYRTGGARVDSRFTLAYVRDMSLASNPNERGAYVYSYNQSASYTTSSAYQFNTKASSNVAVTRLGAGSYNLTLKSMPSFNKTIAMVTAYGSNRNCTVGFWSTSGVDTRVRVNCAAPNGIAVDSRFTLSYSTNRSN